MLLQDIASLGKMLGQFLNLFACCFHGVKGRRLLAVYIRGLLSDLQRKNVEAIALKQNVRPRTLQRFLESIKWDYNRLMQRCRQLIVEQAGQASAIGVIDETGIAKSGRHTTGVKRQYNGNRGKVENAVVTVALSLATESFQCLAGAQLYLPDDWANDERRRKKIMYPMKLLFKRNLKLH